MKLRVVYNQTANAFHTIHKMDHFHVDIEKVGLPPSYQVNNLHLVL